MFDFTTIVTGVPRSGTSMVMQMLAAGGLPVLTDRNRPADEDNPGGYLEFERVRHLRSDKSWLNEANGKALKVIHLLMTELPVDRPYRVIFLKRDLQEVVKSQSIMLARTGKTGATIAPEKLTAIFEKEIIRILKWLSERSNFEVLVVHYADVINQPLEQSIRINLFLGGKLNEDAMAGAVDEKLYRNR